MKIRSYFIFCFLAINVICLTIAAAASYHIAKAQLTSVRTQQLQTVVLERKKDLNYIVQAWSERSALIGSRTQFRLSLYEHLQHTNEQQLEKIKLILHDALSSIGSLNYIRVCDEKRNSIVEVGTSGTGHSCKKQSDNPLSPLHDLWINKTTRKRQVLIVNTITLPKNQIAYLMTVYDATELESFSKNYNGLGETGETLIAKPLNENIAQIISPLRHARESQRAFYSVDIQVADFLKDAFHEDTIAGKVTFKTDYRNIRVLSTSVYMPNLGLAVIAKIDKVEALGPANILMRDVVLITLCTTIVAAILGFIASIFLSRPISLLSQAAAKIRNEEWEGSIDVHGSEEIHTLTKAFNDMVATLIERENIFKSAMDNAPIGMALVSPNGQFMRVNTALAIPLGYSVDELNSMNFQSITHAEDLPKNLAQLGDMLKKNSTSYTDIKRYIRKDNSIMWARVSVALVFDKFSNPKYFVAQVVDITDQMAAATLLTKNKAHLDTLINTVPDGVVSFDEKYIIKSVNNAFKKITGYYHEELYGTDLRKLINFDGFEKSESNGHIKATFGLETYCAHKNSIKIPIEIDIGRTSIEDEILYVAIVRDTQSRKHKEQ